LQQENDRLKLHIQSRQHEIAEMRGKLTKAVKEVRDKGALLESNLREKYKDRLSDFVKVLDQELSRLSGLLLREPTKN
jgi:hypothetical protein